MKAQIPQNIFLPGCIKHYTHTACNFRPCFLAVKPICNQMCKGHRERRMKGKNVSFYFHSGLVTFWIMASKLQESSVAERVISWHIEMEPQPWLTPRPPALPQVPDRSWANDIISDKGNNSCIPVCAHRPDLPAIPCCCLLYARLPTHNLCDKYDRFISPANAMNILKAGCVGVDRPRGVWLLIKGSVRALTHTYSYTDTHTSAHTYTRHIQIKWEYHQIKWLFTSLYCEALKESLHHYFLFNFFYLFFTFPHKVLRANRGK